MDFGRPFPPCVEFLHGVTGPEAQQLATYIGWLMHRHRGGIIAGALFVLPSFFLLIVLTWIYLTYGNAPEVAGVLYGNAGVIPVLLSCGMLGMVWRLTT